MLCRIFLSEIMSDCNILLDDSFFVVKSLSVVLKLKTA